MERTLIHHGIKGQKWGIRRYQNPDGTLTPAGRERYYKDRVKQLKTEYYNKTEASKRSKQGLEKYIRKNYGDTYSKDKSLVAQRRTSRVATGILLTTGAIATTGVLYEIGSKNISDRFQAQREYRMRNSMDLIDDIINDEDTIQIISKGSKIYRSVDESNDKPYNQSLYVTDNKRDASFYKASYSPLEGKKKEITYTTNKDIYTAQGKSLVNYALNALGYDKDIDYINNHLDEDKNRYAKYEAYSAIRNLYDKDENGNVSYPKSAKLREKLIEEGYDAVKDYNNAGTLSKQPKILLNPEESVKFENIRNISSLEKAINVFKFINKKEI